MGYTDRREVKQFQFTAWPDHGVPEHSAPFLQFIRWPLQCHIYYTLLCFNLAWFNKEWLLFDTIYLQTDPHAQHPWQRPCGDPLQRWCGQNRRVTCYHHYNYHWGTLLIVCVHRCLYCHRLYARADEARENGEDYIIVILLVYFHSSNIIPGGRVWSRDLSEGPEELHGPDRGSVHLHTRCLARGRSLALFSRSAWYILFGVTIIYWLLAIILWITEWPAIGK